MHLHDLIHQRPQWLDDDSPDASVAVLSQCTLARNLSDFPFPHRCAEHELLAVEQRVIEVLDGLNLMAHGCYCPLSNLAPWEVGLLAERHFITESMMEAPVGRGVYINQDQNLCIMVNARTHLCSRSLFSGQQIREAWAQLNLMDDTLSGLLDFAFHERLGFLTTDLSTIGTGLRASVLLHLPALSVQNRLSAQAQRAAKRQHALWGVQAGAPLGIPGEREINNSQALLSEMDGAVECDVREAEGDLFLLVNKGTLGQSEEEIVYNVHESASEIVEAERATRAELLSESPRGLEDRVGRARGMAQGSRIMEFSEGLKLLSSLRLGVDTHVLASPSMGALNMLLLQSQGAHLACDAGKDCDPMTLSVARADLFRKILELPGNAAPENG